MTTTTGFRPSTRLPDTGPRKPRMRERLGALGALLAILVLVVGVPTGLVLFVGDPLPTTLPSKEWLTAQLSTGVLLNVLACVVWLVWAHFVVCLVAEWSSARRGRLPSAVPLGGGSQLVARRLVAALLLLAGAATLAPTSHAPDRAAASVSSTLQNTAQEVAVAAPVTASDQSLVHYQVSPPEGRNYDCLWDIAERTLGDPMRYKEIFALNKDRVQPDGRRLVDADLIQPGWVLVLPADASGPGTVRTEPIRMSTLAGQLSAVPDLAAPEAPAGSATAEAPGTVITTPAPALTQRDLTPDLAHGLIGGGLLLAGLALALSTRRGPYGEPQDGEERLRLAAEPARSLLLDAALRHLSAAQSAAGAPLPEVLLAFVSTSEVVLHLAAASGPPPAPWTPSEDGRSWSVQAPAVEALGAPPSDVAAPYPALVNVLASHGYEVLVDLEAAPGLVAVGGDATAAREVVTSLAVELATNGWSDGVRVSLVGFGDDLAALAPQALQQFDRLEDVLPHAEAEGAQFGGLLASLGVDGVLSGRAVRGSERWRPHVLVLSGPPTAQDAVRLQALTGAGRTPVAVVCVGDSVSARWRFVASGAGALDLGVLGVEGLARRLPQAEYRSVIELLQAAEASAAQERRNVPATSPAGAATARGPVRPPDPAPAVVVRLLGPVQVEVLTQGPAVIGVPGLAKAVTPTPASGLSGVGNLPLLTEVVVAATLHPEGLHDATLRSSVWPRGVGDDVVDRTVQEVQDWLGRDYQDQPRLRRGDDGLWRLHGVGSDRDLFASLAAGAAGESELAALQQALALGRGEVFSSVPASRYSWLAFHRAARDTRVLVAATARRASALAHARDDVRAARQALHQGLGMVPTAEVLWRDLLLLDGGDSPHAAATLASQMYGTLAFHGVPLPESETDALVDSLAPGFRPRTA